MSFSHLHPTIRKYVRSRPIADGYDVCFADNPLFEYDCTFIREYLRPPAMILDVGCGTGRHLAFLAGSGFRVVGLDLNPHMIALAKVNLADRGLETGLILADMHCLPFGRRPVFDGILLMFSTLGLVYGSKRRRNVLRALAGRLKPGGRLIAHFHNFFHNMQPGFADRIRRSLSGVLGGDEPGDVIMRQYRGIQDLYLHSFTAGELREMFGACGLRIIEMRILNEERNGRFTGSHGEERGNGFLVAAEPDFA